MKRSVIGAVKLLSPNHLGPGLTLQLPPPSLHTLPRISVHNEKKVNNCILLPNNRRSLFIKIQELDKLVISLTNIQFSDLSTRIFRILIYQVSVILSTSSLISTEVQSFFHYESSEQSSYIYQVSVIPSIRSLISTEVQSSNHYESSEHPSIKSLTFNQNSESNLLTNL